MSKKYIDVVGNGVNALRVEVYYSLGGMNYFTYKNEPRGYYLSVSPVEHTVRNGVTMEGYAAFSGYKVLLHEVTRKSKKAEAIAEEKAKDAMQGLIDSVCTKNGLTIKE